MQLSNLSVHHGASTILSGINAVLPSGQVTALIGPNGVGKSSLLRAIAGLSPCRGGLLIGGATQTRAQLKERVAYMPQETAARSSLTLLEVVLLGRVASLGLSVPHGLLAQAEAALDHFGLLPLCDRTLDTVSGGQRQMTYLAQALFRAPDVLLLDEPTAALDLRHQLVVLDTIRQLADQRNVTVVIALHDLSLAAQFSDRMMCLHRGGLHAEGTPEAVLTAACLRDVYGVAADISQGPDGRPRVDVLSAL
ncbi:ABC transporter ATP-binding protein [Thalassococcus sp. S3]|uniref:ABC transporter ATP-binding protein n=1 Tax=Thalassococcus sp. S3 TaxID=2017482 RepID=UPI0010241034|nr:ABC transporter ATP-binding protein [Thalassococcus sp. S3]QBF33652.1 hypothetical protein CFI11_20895 [Thalassococcus sp. S3]